MTTPDQHNTPYNQAFYELIRGGSHRSAHQVLPLLLELLQPHLPQRVVDVGCGVGTWLSVFRDLGIEDCTGLDGDYVDRAMLQIPAHRFIPHDLKHPLPDLGCFDLALSLEVAEHLPADCAASFVQSLTKLAPVILFSAAIPFQGGHDHINEQWPTYWVELFQQQGYLTVDGLRSQIWDNPEVEPWYAQNLLIFVQAEQIADYPALQQAQQTTRFSELTRVHPQIFLNSLRATQANSRRQPPTPQSVRLTGDRPLVSVVIPCYNQAHFLPEAVASVLGQTYDHWEIVIINDGSPDNTSEIAHRLIDLYPEKTIRLVEQTNGGLPKARNTGIEAARGEYILPLDADDRLDPQAIAYLLDLCLAQEQPAVAFGSYQMFDLTHDRIASLTLFSPENLKRNNMLHPSSLFAKVVWQTVGGYKLGFEGYEDWEFWLHCLEQGIPFTGTQEVVVYYRRREESMVSKALIIHDRLYAQLVTSHPALYTAPDVAIARATLTVFERLNQLGIESPSHLEHLIQQYQQPAGEHVASQLHLIRRAIAEFWLGVTEEQMPAYLASTLLKIQDLLRQSGLRTEPLPTGDRAWVEQLRTEVGLDTQQGLTRPAALQRVMAALLYFDAHRLSLPVDLTPIPADLLKSYLSSLLTPPDCFQSVGEVEQYTDFLASWTRYLYQQVRQNPGESFWQQAMLTYVNQHNLTPLYASSRKLRDLCEQRSALIAMFLEQVGLPLEYTFPEPSTHSTRLRLGVVCDRNIPAPSGWSSLPIDAVLDRQQFKVIFYLPPGMGDCSPQPGQEDGDRVVQLSADLAEMVQQIRADHLDVLVMESNLVSVLNHATLLANYRLARVQLVSAASPITTGLHQIDGAFLLSTAIEPNTLQLAYSEPLVCLEVSASCFRWTEATPHPPFTPALRSQPTAEQSLQYVAIAPPHQITPETQVSWARILAAVPHARLLYLSTSDTRRDDLNRSLRRSLETALLAQGVSGDRCTVLAVGPDPANWQSFLHRGDVYLEPFPYADLTTVLSPLSLGIPTVVLASDSPYAVGRSASLLRELGLEELIADQPTTYETVAIALGNNPIYCQQVGDCLKANWGGHLSFLDSQRYGEAIGNSLKHLVQQSQARLTQDFCLSQINLLVFPDWSQPEDLLFPELVDLLLQSIRAVEPISNQGTVAGSGLTLLVDTTGIEADEADLAISSVVMYLLTEEGIEVGEAGPAVVLLTDMSPSRWNTLLPQVTARVALPTENTTALHTAQATQLPVWQLETLGMNAIDWTASVPLSGISSAAVPASLV